ncbi:MAG TPA: alpha/beta fold hydrolase [Pseudonocardia sp.]|nr:alpha/beta fold hydrolase [Pseudonocardia sp.]
MTTTPATGEQLGAVLVHGMWHGGWAWDAVRAELDAVGVPSAAVELPMTDLASDVAATRRVLDEFGRPAVLVGHSYGGAVITAAGVHDHVRHLVYLAAFQLDEGESVRNPLAELALPPTRLGEAMRFSADGTEIGLDPALAVEFLYGDAAPADAEAAVARLRAVRRDILRGVPAEIAWRRVPSTYVVCAEDLAINPDLQRAMAARASDRVEWPGGHSPACTRPKAVADLVASLAAPAG